MLINIKIEQNKDYFAINDCVQVAKKDLREFFPSEKDVERSMHLLLAISPWVNCQAAHLISDHNLSDRATKVIAYSVAIIYTIKLPEEAFREFTVSTMELANTNPNELGDFANAIFGECNDHSAHTKH